PSNTVTLWFWISSSAFTGSNLGSSARQAPLRTEVFSPQVSPNTWNSGRQPITTSPAPVPSSSSTADRALAARLWCDSEAPLGLPVVPEVYSSTAMSSSARDSGSASGVTPESSPADSPIGPTTTTSTPPDSPAAAAAAPPSGNESNANATLTPASEK